LKEGEDKFEKFEKVEKVEKSAASARANDNSLPSYHLQSRTSFLSQSRVSENTLFVF
jgi:hypothetical protein